MTLRRTALIAALLLGAEAPRIFAQTRDSSRLAIDLPDSVRTFVRTEMKQLANPAEGYVVRYRRVDGLAADVFVYPGPDFASNCDLACARNVMEREGGSLVASFPEIIRRKYIDTVGTVHDSAVTPASSEHWRLGRHIQFETRIHGEPRWSDMFLFYAPGLRIKVRATYVPGELQRANIAEFARAAVDAITGGTVAHETDRPDR